MKAVDHEAEDRASTALPVADSWEELVSGWGQGVLILSQKQDPATARPKHLTDLKISIETLHWNKKHTSN